MSAILPNYLSPREPLFEEEQIEPLFAGECEALFQNDASYSIDDYKISATAPSAATKQTLNPLTPSKSSESSYKKYELLSPTTPPALLDEKTRVVIVDNILLLIRRHSTTQESLVYWCESSPLTIAKLLNTTRFCMQTVAKIAEYYHVTQEKIVSPKFKHEELECSYPMPQNAIDEKKAKLLRIGKRIAALCHLGKVTDKQLAECCKCDERAISEIKKGLYPNFLLIDKIAKICKTTREELANPNVTLPELTPARQDQEGSASKATWEHVAGNIGLLLQHHNVTRKMLAKWCNCSPSTISKVKNGSSHFSSVIKKVAAYFHLTVEQLSAANFKEKQLVNSSPQSS